MHPVPLKEILLREVDCKLMNIEDPGQDGKVHFDRLWINQENTRSSFDETWVNVATLTSYDTHVLVIYCDDIRDDDFNFSKRAKSSEYVHIPTF